MMKEQETNKGQFQKGNQGKPKGAKNKFTRSRIKRMQEVVLLLDSIVDEDIMKMSPTRRVELWRDLHEFILPKLQRTNLEVAPKNKGLTKITFEIVNSKRNEQTA